MQEILQQEENDFSSEYHMQFLVFNELHRIRLKKSEFAIQKDLIGWCNCLREIYRLIYSMTNASRDQKIDNRIEETFIEIEKSIDKNYDNIMDRTQNKWFKSKRDREGYMKLNALDKEISLVMKNILSSNTVKGINKLKLGLGNLNNFDKTKTE